MRLETIRNWMEKINLKISRENRSGIIVCRKSDPGRLVRAALPYDKSLLIMPEDMDEKLKRRLKKSFPGEVFLMSRGRGKELAEAEKIWGVMLKKGFSRDSVIIAAGGGKISDMAGLAASLYMRGIKWVSIPTTFLGQIDAAIGGKTAVDFAGVKNVIGSFYLPAFTVMDISLLEVLPASKFREAAGEIYKYIMITGKKTSAKLARLLPGAERREEKAVYECVLECARFKARVVEKDFLEEKGIRETLNFGHTAGHAVEILCALPHGTAVWWGIKYALGLSLETGLMKKAEHERLLKLLGSRDGKEILKLKGAFGRFLEIVRSDKKKRGRNNYFVLLRRRGKTAGLADIPERILKSAYSSLTFGVNGGADEN